MKRPKSFTLSTEDGEAILARLSIYAPGHSDCEILMQVMRWYFWLVNALQETKITGVCCMNRPDPTRPS